MAGRGATLGASVLGAGSLAVGGLLVPVAGIGLGLAAGGYVLYRRRGDAGPQAGPRRRRVRAVPAAGAVGPAAGADLAAGGARRGAGGAVRRDLLPVHRPAVRAGRGGGRRGGAAAAGAGCAHRRDRRGG